MQKIYVTGAADVSRLNALCTPHDEGCADACTIEHEHIVPCPSDCTAHAVFDWWFGAIDEGVFWGVVLPRPRDWDCRRRLLLAGFQVFPSAHSPHELEKKHVDKVAHTRLGRWRPDSSYTMRDVALALHDHYGHPALHPDA